MHLDSLQNSVMFHLSSYSKETFHSAFLYWLSCLDIDKTISMFRYLLNDDYFLREGKYVSYREKDKFDFSIWQHNGKKEELVFVLENKFKSIATTEQLDRYATFINEKGYCVKAILLTFARQISGSFSKENYYECDGIKWVMVDYPQYVAAIKRAFLNGEKEICQYHKDVIEDYCQYIEDLRSIVQEREENPLKKIDEDLSKLRLDSFLQKTVYSIALNNLNEKLRERGYAVLTLSTINTIRKVCNNDNKEDLERIVKPLKGEEEKPLIFTNTGYTHKHGVVELKFMKKNERRFLYLIQVQGKYIRFGIEYLETDVERTGESESVKTDLPNVKTVFKFLNTCNVDTIYSFKPDFFYYKDSMIDYTAERVAKEMVEYLNENKESILSYNEIINK